MPTPDVEFSRKLLINAKILAEYIESRNEVLISTTSDELIIKALKAYGG